jgi:hypothetical protein
MTKTDDFADAEIFDFFLSHSSKTKELARYIYYNSKFNGLHPWYDENNLETGVVLEGAIKQGIERSKAFLLLHSQPALESEWVKAEMKLAKIKRERDPNFKIIVLKLDELEPSNSWKDFLYQEWNFQDSFGSILRLIESVTGNKGIMKLTASSLLLETPFMNESGIIAEHTRNYVLYYLSHIKNLISTTVSIGHDDELRDTLENILKLSLFSQVPNLEGGMMPAEPSVWEIIHGTRMRIPPHIEIQGLPEKYECKIIENNEIFTKIQILDKRTKEPINHIVPISIVFSSEL